MQNRSQTTTGVLSDDTKPLMELRNLVKLFSAMQLL